MESTNEERHAWLARRLGFGSAIASLDSNASVEVELIVDSMFDVAQDPDLPSPWASVDLGAELDREAVQVAASAWLAHLTTAAELNSWMTWFWHDHFAVSAPVVKPLSRFTVHIELLQRKALDAFGSLLREVTTDPAMLIFLNGRQNAAGQVNENYGRELLELYALGIGNYDESDVRAAAVALTGWAFRREDEGSTFVPSRHVDAPQELLGVSVNDVDSVIDVVSKHPACAEHIVNKLSTAVLGAPLEGSLAKDHATLFSDSSLDTAALLRSLIELGLDGHETAIVLAPVPWLLQAEAMTSAQVEDRERLFLLRQMGQIPGVPPNVGGYPGEDTWAGPSTTIGRFRAASLIAARTPDEAPILASARARNWVDVAYLAARPRGFSPETIAALDDANTTRRNGREALAAALMSPELAVA